MPPMRIANRRRQQQAAWGALLVAAFAQLTPSAVHGESGESGTSEPTEVLASFDTGQITRGDYERVLTLKSARERELIARPGGREGLLEKLIRYDLLAQEAERRGYGDHLEVKIAAGSAASEQMLAALFTVDRAKIPAAEVERAYAERKHEFGRPHMRRATHIRVATEAEAKALIAELTGKDRETFSRAARDKNIDPRTRNQGGELGFFGRDGKTESGRPTAVPIELVNETFARKRVGEVAPKPIAEGGSWHVLMYTGEMEPITKTLAELDPILREAIATKQEAVAVDALVAELRAKTPVVMHPELTDAVVLPPHEPRDMPEGFAAAPPDPRAPPVIMEPDGI